MGQDYNIYIHGKGLNDKAQTDTIPRDNQINPDGTPAIDDSVAPFIQKGIQQGENFISNGFQNVVNGGIAALSKASPWIAISIAAIKIGEKILTTSAEHMSDYTGNYQFSMGMNNLKTIVGNGLNPVGYGMKIAHFTAQANKERLRIDQEKQIIGNSMLGKVKIGI